MSRTIWSAMTDTERGYVSNLIELARDSIKDALDHEPRPLGRLVAEELSSIKSIISAGTGHRVDNVGPYSFPGMARRAREVIAWADQWPGDWRLDPARENLESLAGWADNMTNRYRAYA